ncbi:MAG: hypothetical protein GX316_01390 [Firmicutes bacterium]|nr:hypothetical protein [Bacillota bacterium]
MVEIRELTTGERKEIALRALRENYPQVNALQPIGEAAFCSIYRVPGEGRVIKVAAKERIDLEMVFYGISDKYKIPGIDHQRLNDNVLCLEDLQTSSTWTLASEEDIYRSGVGLACANWYDQFHKAGEAELKANRDPYNKSSQI